MAMRLWVSHRSDVPIPEQIATQIILGILGDDLLPGQRLPSTRALARRFQIHPNTVTAGYRQLERDGWVEIHHGSGAYVRSHVSAVNSNDPPAALDRSIAQLFHAARKLDIPLAQLRARLQTWLALQPPDHFLVVEPDEELRQIVIHEIQAAVTLPVKGCSLEDCSREEIFDSAIPVALPSKVERVRTCLPPGVGMIELRVRSAPASLAQYLPAPSDALVAIASRWNAFRTLAHTMLIAAGFHADALLFRDAREPGWQDALEPCAAIVCDSLTATQFAGSARVVCFSLLTEASLRELSHYRQFVDDGDLPNGAVEEVSQDAE